jgi:hypothetical protein
MPIHVLVSFLFLSVLGVLALPQLGRLWRHQTTFYDGTPGWWSYGKPVWRGWVRALPMLASVAYLGLLIAAYLGFVSPFFHLSRQADLVVIVIFLISFLGAFLLALTIFLFNFPRLAVPPHLRNQPGALEKWLVKRRRADSRSGLS